MHFTKWTQEERESIICFPLPLRGKERENSWPIGSDSLDIIPHKIPGDSRSTQGMHPKFIEAKLVGRVVGLGNILLGDTVTSLPP